MTADLNHAIRSSLGDIIAAAPHPDDEPVHLMTIDHETPTRGPYLAVGPLALGQALRLSIHPATLNTVPTTAQWRLNSTKALRNAEHSSVGRRLR